MKIVSYIIGIIVTLAGIVGFLSESILGMINTNAIQNVIYIVLGLLLLISVMKGKAILAKIIGIIFAVLGILGLVMSGDKVIGLIESSNTGDWFHLIVGIVVLLIAFMEKGGSSRSSSINNEMNNSQTPPHNQQM